MRRPAALLLLLSFSCTTAPPPAASAPVSEPGGAYGLTVEEEAQILAIEDRRAYDPAIVEKWARHTNSLHRIRIALALGRIGFHDFIDIDNDGRFDPDERRAGVRELIELAHDPEPQVRTMAVFALGETGDQEALTTLLHATADPDAGVAAESVEAISKIESRWLTNNRGRYIWLTQKGVAEGVRARAIRYLFRFDKDDLSGVAIEPLGDESPLIRQEAAYSLMRRPVAGARAQLELLTNDVNPLTRAYVVGALGKIGAAESMPVLIEALGDIHPWVRTNAAVAIGRVAEKTPAALKADHLPRIFAALEDPDPGVRSSAIETLGHYAVVNETARAKLLEMTEMGSQWNRDLAVIAFLRQIEAHAKRDAAGPRVSLDEAYARYREQFEPILSPWGLARSIEAAQKWPYIRPYLEHADPAVRAATITTMPDRTAENQRLKLKVIFETDPDVIVRAAAIERYGKTKEEDADIWLAALVAAELRERKAAMNDARLAAINAIAELDDPGRETFLQKLANDSTDPVVRRVAAELFASKFKTTQPKYTPLPVKRSAADYEEIVRWSRTPHTATIHMPRGKIELALLTQDAPMTTWNFAELARKKFYDNTSFMRVVPNFVIQGGDPRNDQNGGPGYAIRDEINLQKYTRGAVGMALSGPDTGGSQFFITHSPQPHLDGGYTIFARVYDGMSSVVDQVERADRVTTITIDEHPPVGAPEIDSVPNVSLPLRVGAMTAESILSHVPGYEERRASYQIDPSVVEMLATYIRPGDRIEVYMGTWCHDSLREVPKLLRINQELTNQGVTIPTAFVALDRAKQLPGELMDGKTISKVATFIYYRGDRELGRIEEKPTGIFEDDLLAIAARE